MRILLIIAMLAALGGCARLNASSVACTEDNTARSLEIRNADETLDNLVELCWRTYEKTP